MNNFKQCIFTSNRPAIIAIQPLSSNGGTIGSIRDEAHIVRHRPAKVWVLREHGWTGRDGLSFAVEFCRIQQSSGGTIVGSSQSNPFWRDLGGTSWFQCPKNLRPKLWRQVSQNLLGLGVCNSYTLT